jgi:uncharacterized membrane protein YphA (DoxX/SURF4 family)
MPGSQGALSPAGLKRAVIYGPDQLARQDPATRTVAVVSGVIFVGAGLVKFVFHHWELHAFRSFGLPWPAVLEIFAGLLETAGGVLLVLRRYVVPVALLLSATMLVAIASSGIGHGDVIPSLTLAPALLLAMIYLLARALSNGAAKQLTGPPSPDP